VDNTAENFGVARVAGLGNKIDIEDSEVLEYLGEDPETKGILMYVEGFREPRRFLQVAKQVTRKKPVVILKGGRTKAGAERAFSHTASLAGRFHSGRGFQTGGIAREALCRPGQRGQGIASVLPGRRVSSLAPSGALGVVVADACDPQALRSPVMEASLKKPRRSAPPG
jgi:acyl-CoA synthetase (NDP forming)